jgi:hypothetical protein
MYDCCRLCAAKIWGCCEFADSICQELIEELRIKRERYGYGVDFLSGELIEDKRKNGQGTITISVLGGEKKEKKNENE